MFGCFVLFSEGHLNFWPTVYRPNEGCPIFMKISPDHCYVGFTVTFKSKKNDTLVRLVMGYSNRHFKHRKCLVSSAFFMET